MLAGAPAPFSMTAATAVIENGVSHSPLVESDRQQA
jgi:hypothetical protein